MKNQIRYAIALSVFVMWSAAMINWIFIEHRQPDPIAWGVPEGIWLALFPSGIRKQTRRDDE